MHDQSDSRVLPANEYRRERWRNGMGWTRQIHAEPAPGPGPSADGSATGAPGWAWRMSIAEIERDTAFSRFPGVERILVLVTGNGVRLRLDGAPPALLAPPHAMLRFPGGAEAAGDLVEGPVHAFNLMWRDDLVEADLWHRPLVGPMVIFVDPATCWAVHVLGGEGRFDSAARLPPLASGDTALLRAPDARRRYVLDGGGEVLLARLRSRATGTATGTG